MGPRKFGTYSDCRRNALGGYYLKGEPYNFAKKIEIISNYFVNWEKTFPTRPVISEVARQCKVERSTVRRFIGEFNKNGRTIDPKAKKWEKEFTDNNRNSVFHRLTLEEETFLMSLHAADPSRPNQSYVEELKKEHNKNVTSTFITRWFKYRYEYNGNFCVSIKVPTDKFREVNWYKYFEYRMMLNLISDHGKFNFLDEKHIWNHNGNPIRVRRNPITGIIPSIKVSGNFRDSQSIIACITTKKTKQQKLFFTMGKGNNDSDSFMLFIRLMIAHGYLLHDEVLVMDNCSIHHQGFAEELQKFVWNFEVANKPLHVLVLYLPPRAPELNPIELIFNILVQRMRSFKYRQQGPLNSDLVKRVSNVLTDIGNDHDLILRCCQHCGYDVHCNEKKNNG